MNESVLIVGLGEVGKSILELYNHIQSYKDNIYYKDVKECKGVTAINVNTLEDFINVNILHICIPFTKDFKDVVTSYINIYKPSLTLIHSTVDIGVTRSIYSNNCNSSNSCNSVIAHTPVMGVHPNLTKSIQTFKKIVGVINPEDKEVILNHFNIIKVIPEFYDSPEDSEAAKLFSTTYYGHNIKFMQEAHKFCEVNNLDFDKVYKRTNEIYNEGYTKMDMKHVRRPILKYMPGKISGHCLIPNAEILKDKFPIAKELVKYNDNL